MIRHVVTWAEVSLARERRENLEHELDLEDAISTEQQAKLLNATFSRISDACHLLLHAGCDDEVVVASLNSLMKLYNDMAERIRVDVREADRCSDWRAKGLSIVEDSAKRLTEIEVGLHGTRVVPTEGCPACSENPII